MPANQILGLLPGEIFVHRNVANVVVHSDLNCLSVIQFPVDVLMIRHIIVCGDYACGGVAAAMRDDKLGLTDNWLGHVQDVRNRNRDELGRLQRTLSLTMVYVTHDIEDAAALADRVIVMQAGHIVSMTEGHKGDKRT